VKYLKNIVSVFFILCCLLSTSGSGSANSYSSVLAPSAKLPEAVENKTDFNSQESIEDKTTEQAENEKEPEDKLEQPQKITISFVGDCLIATSGGATNRVGSLNWTADQKPASYFFEKVADVFFEDDFTVANCENVFTDSALSPIKKSGKAFWFRSATKNASIFTSGGVDIVSIANNHTLDYGEQGFFDTVKALETAGLKVGYNNHPVIVEKNGIRIGIICCDLWSYSHYGRTVKQVKEIEPETDIQIVFFHGGQEKIHKPEGWKVAAARKIVDAGADLVIGSHPHVLQPVEIYRDVPIVYSLGNFVYGGNTRPENRTIIFQAFFEVFAGAVKISYDIIPCYVYTGNTNNWQPDKIVNRSEKEKVLEFMNGRRGQPY
jgi:hypothetical protein